MTSFVAIYLATFLMVVVITRRDQTAVRGGCLVFLIMIALFAPLKVKFGPVMTNISVIPASAFTSCMIMLTINHGFKYAMKIALAIAQWLVYMQFVIFFMSKITPDMFLDDQFNLVAVIITNNTFHSFFATYVSSIMAVGAITIVANSFRGPQFLRYMHAALASFLFSGVAFYTLAFTSDPTVFRQALISIPIKLLMSLLYYPIVAYMRTEVEINNFAVGRDY